MLALIPKDHVLVHGDYKKILEDYARDKIDKNVLADKLLAFELDKD